MSAEVMAGVRVASNDKPSNWTARAPVEQDPNYLADLTPPPFLISSAAIQMWECLAPKLAKAPRLLSDIDILTFASYCMDVAKCWEALLANGNADALLIAVGCNNQPAFTLRNQASERGDEGAIHAGLSPFARTKIRTNPQEDLFGECHEFPSSRPTPAAAQAMEPDERITEDTGTGPRHTIQRHGQCRWTQTREGELRSPESHGLRQAAERRNGKQLHK